MEKYNKQQFIDDMSNLYDSVLETLKLKSCINLDFSHALLLLKEGKKVRRKGWNGKGMWIELQKPDEHSKMSLPYLYLNYPKGDKYHNGCRVPWLPSQTDILEDDWEVVE